MKKLAIAGLILIGCGGSSPPSNTAANQSETIDTSKCTTTVTDQGWLVVSCPGYAPFVRPPQMWMAPILRKAVSP